MAIRFAVILFFLAYCCEIVSSDDENKVIVLDDDNFEHLTQASTGATTGDWLVLFTKEDDCKPCKESKIVFEKLNKRLSRRMNVAVINPSKNKGLLRRFGIKNLPVVYLFRHGFQFVYVGELSENQIEIFALSSFKDSPRQPVKEPMGSFDLWKEDTIKEVMDCIKHRKLPSYSTLFLAIGSLAVSLVFLLCCCSGTAPDTTKKDQ